MRNKGKTILLVVVLLLPIVVTIVVLLFFEDAVAYYLFSNPMLRIAIALDVALILLLLFVLYRYPFGRKSIKTSLLQSWTELKNRLPHHVAIRLSRFQPVLLLGEDETAKQDVVDQYTQWRSYAAEQDIRYPENPVLPIMLSPQMYVVALPRHLMIDRSRAVQTALQRLWASVFDGNRPLVVIVLNSAELLAMQPDRLNEQAFRIRNRIGLLSTVCRISCVHIALAYFDQVEGYHAYIEYSNLINTPPYLTISAHESPSLEQRLGDRETQIARGLVGLDADQFNELLSFFENGPQRLLPVNRVIDAIQQLHCIRTINVFLTSRDAGERLTANPFVYSKIEPSNIRHVVSDIGV